MLDETTFKENVIPAVHLKRYLVHIGSDSIFFFLSFSPVPPESLVNNGVLVVILNYLSSLSVHFPTSVGRDECGSCPNISLQVELKETEVKGVRHWQLSACVALWRSMYLERVNTVTGDTHRYVLYHQLIANFLASLKCSFIGLLPLCHPFWELL